MSSNKNAEWETFFELEERDWQNTDECRLNHEQLMKIANA